MYQLTLCGIRVCSQSTSSAADSRVKTSRRLGEVRALKAAGRVYGERCLGLSGKSDPLGSSLRTYLRSACEALTGLSLRWKESATPAGHWWLDLKPWAGTFRDAGYGLLPGPQASDYKRGICKNVHCAECHKTNRQCSNTLTAVAVIHDRHDLKLSPHFRSKLMGWPEDYYRKLETLCCEWQETVGVTRTPCSSTNGSPKPKG